MNEGFEVKCLKCGKIYVVKHEEKVYGLDEKLLEEGLLLRGGFGGEAEMKCDCGNEVDV